MSSGAAFLIVMASAAISAGLIALSRPYLQRYALARPNARSSHREPTPQGGGIAVIAATLLVAVATMALFGFLSDLKSLSLLLGAAALIALMGAIDDIRTIGIAPRLLLQIVAVTLVLVALPADMRIVPQLPWWVERALLLVGCVWFVNLVNFMDGIDWMTVAEIVPVTAALAALGLAGALPLQGAIVALALGGAVLGFAPFNRPVARLFLGNVGSFPIGLLTGWLLILLAGAGHLAAALLLPLYYVVDATTTLLRRIIAREPFWRAHRNHFYQQALDRGFSVRDVVARVFAVNIILALLAITTVLTPGPTTTWIALACGVALVAWLLVAMARGKP